MSLREHNLPGSGIPPPNEDPTDLVGQYIREAGKTPLLTKQREIDLAKRIEAGKAALKTLLRRRSSTRQESILQAQIADGKEARDLLIRSNVRLVISIAKRYQGRGVEFIDLIQEGNLGVMKAVDKFDYRRGNKFGTHATWWIRQGITRAIADQGNTIRIPTHIQNTRRKIWVATDSFVQQHGTQTNREELAAALNIKVSILETVLAAQKLTASLDEPLKQDEDKGTLEDIVPDPRSIQPQQALSQNQLREQIEKALSYLSPKDAEILRLRFGLVDEYPHTLEEVGQKFGVTRERIRQLEESALTRLHDSNQARKLKDYL